MENIQIKKELLKILGNTKIWNTSKSRTFSYRRHL